MPKPPSFTRRDACPLLHCLRSSPVCRKIKKEVGIENKDVTLIDAKKGRKPGILVVIIANKDGLYKREVQISKDVINELLIEVLLWTTGGKCRGCCPDSRGNGCLQRLGEANGLLPSLKD